MTRSASMLANVRCVLCGDLGGTNSRLELFRLQHSASKRDLEAIGTEPPLYAQTYKTNNLPGDFTELLHAFLAEANVGLVELAAGCLAVAGPVEEGDRVTFTNLGWRIEARLLEAEFRMQPGTMRLVNDFVANGFGVVTLRDGDYSTLNGPAQPSMGAPIACVGAGTGLGEAYATSSGGVYEAWPSEGGHVAFAPRDATQTELLTALQKRFGGRVSAERVISGKGIVNVYDFFAEKFPDKLDKDLQKRIKAHPEGAGVIARAAYDDHLCGEALNLVLDAYGAELGNAAVKWLPFGGLYVCGGIAVKNRERLKEKVFLEAYKDRGRLRPVLDRVPLRLVLVDDLGLRGAHYVALATLLGGGVVHAPTEEPPAAPAVPPSDGVAPALDRLSAAISRAAAVVSIGLLAAALLARRR